MDRQIRVYLAQLRGFASASFYVPNSNMCPSVDKGLRAQLADNLVTDELMDITDKLFTIALDIRKILQMLCPRKLSISSWMFSTH